MTDEQEQRVRELAPQVALARLQRLHEAGTTSKGRVIGVYVGEPAPCEVEWFQLCEALTADRTLPEGFFQK